MILIHTADLHLGQTLHGYERTLEHERFLRWLLDTLVAEGADALLVAGDVFDGANPPASAVRALNGFLAEAHRRLPALDVVLVAGNHDSAARLESSAPLFEAHRVTAVGSVPRGKDGEPDVGRLVVPLHDAAGRVGAYCLAVPFLRSPDLPASNGGAEGPVAGVTELYRRALEHALAQGGLPVVALGHCHLAKGELSEASERPVIIGGAEALPLGVFDPRLAYVGLGHLHRAQELQAEPPVRYAGSPLPMSFAELGYKHAVLRVELVEGRAVVTPLPVPRTLDLLRVPADGARPVAEVVELLRGLALPPRPLPEQPLLEVCVLLEAPEPGLRKTIEDALAAVPARLARVEVRYPAKPEAGGAEGVAPAPELGKLSPEAVFLEMYKRAFQAEPPEGLRAAFREIAAAAAEEVAA